MIYIIQKNNDRLAKFLRQNRGDEFVEEALNATNPIKQIRYCTAFCLKYEPIYTLEGYTNLHGLDLSLAGAIKSAQFLPTVIKGNVEKAILGVKEAIANIKGLIIDDNDFEF